MKVIYEFALDNMSVFDNLLYDFIFYWIIGEILAYKIAFNAVGFLYKSGLISGRKNGSDAYWSIRWVVVAIFSFLTMLVVVAIKFVYSNLIYIVGLILAAIIIYICYKALKAR